MAQGYPARVSEDTGKICAWFVTLYLHIKFAPCPSQLQHEKGSSTKPCRFSIWRVIPKQHQSHPTVRQRQMPVVHLITSDGQLTVSLDASVSTSQSTMNG